MKNIALIISLLFSLAVSAQTINNVNPVSGHRSETLNVTISGENTHFNQGSYTIVWFSQGTVTLITPNNTTVSDDTHIDASFTFSSSAPLGLYGVNVYSEYDGLLVLENGFLVSSEVFVDKLDDTKLTLMPNPGNGFINLSSKKEINSVNVYDLKGKLINTFDVHSKYTSLDLSSLTKGIYILTIKIQGKILTKKIIIK